jgi:hypothetical protein
LAIAGLVALLLLAPRGARPVVAAAPPLPTFGNPTISGIQGFGFEQDLRLDTHGRVYTSVPGSLGSGLSYVWRSLDRGQTFKWVPAAAQPNGKLGMCNGGGDTELATDSADVLYINDLTLANYGTARSSDHGRTLVPSPCVAVTSTPDDRPWYAVDGDPAQGGSITLTYNVAPNATPLPNPHQCTNNILAFARSPVGAPATAGLEFGPIQALNAPCDSKEGIMGNDEVFTYPNAKRVFVIHDNDPLNQIRMGRCDLVPFGAPPIGSPTGYANCTDNLIADLGSGTVTGGDFPTLTIDRAGNLFTVWEQAPCGSCPNMITGDTVLAYSVSTNQGESWSSPAKLPTGTLHTNVFAWPAAGDAGRVDIAWYGTSAQPVFPEHGPDSVNGDWSLYLTQSLNFASGSPTWTAPILASEHFIHHGSIQTLMGGQSGDRTLGDFLQLRVGLQGEANISYADSNSDTEIIASQGMFVRQIGGSSVLAGRPIVHGGQRLVNAVTLAPHAATFDNLGVSSSNQANLEILGSRISKITLAGTPTYQVQMQVADLTSLVAPGAGGTTLVWSTQWKVPSSTDPHGGAYFHGYMESVAGQAPTFWVGQNAVMATGSVTFTYPGAIQVTGSYAATTPGVITINVPASVVDEPGAIDSLLYSVTAASMTLVVGNAEVPPNLGGIGGNLFNIIDVAPAYDFDPTTSTPPFTTCHEGDGDGQVPGARGGNASFHFDKDRCEDGQNESVDEQDAGSGTDFHSTGFTSAIFDDLTRTLTIVGDGTNAGGAVSFTMVAIDNGVLPGAFSLALSDGYAVSGSLLSGSIQLF